MAKWHIRCSPDPVSRRNMTSRESPDAHLDGIPGSVLILKVLVQRMTGFRKAIVGMNVKLTGHLMKDVKGKLKQA